MIKLALYDVDGVLINGEFATHELERKYGVPLAKSGEFFAKEWADILIGKADARYKLQKYLDEWGWKGSVEDYQKFWFEFESNLDTKLIDHVQQLRAKGIECVIATNQDEHRAKYLLEKLNFKDSFDKMFASAHLGAAKPALGFFEKIIDTYKLEPNEIIFWDDSQENIDAARSLGMHAELYTDFENYLQKMNGIIR